MGPKTAAAPLTNPVGALAESTQTAFAALVSQVPLRVFHRSVWARAAVVAAAQTAAAQIAPAVFPFLRLMLPSAGRTFTPAPPGEFPTPAPSPRKGPVSAR